MEAQNPNLYRHRETKRNLIPPLCSYGTPSPAHSALSDSPDLITARIEHVKIHILH